MWFLTFSFICLSPLALLNIQNPNMLGFVILAPCLGALIIFCCGSRNYHLHRLIALYTTLITLVLSIILWSQFIPNCASAFQQIVGFSAGWKGLLWVRLEFGVDGLSVWIILLTSFLIPLAVLCSWLTINKVSQSFYGLMLLLQMALLGAFSSLDLLQFYVFYECTLLPMFLLIGLGGSGFRKIKAAYLLVLYTIVGSLAILPIVLLIYSGAGTTSYELLAHVQWTPAQQLVLWVGLFLAFAVKVPIMPIHLWLPEAHVEASTAGSVLLAGVLLKLGTFGLLRFSLPLLPYASAYFGPAVIVLSLIGFIYASLTTLRQVDLKKLVAYSSVAHINLVVLSIFCLSSLGYLGSAFLILAHGVASPALFLLVGYLYDRTHTKTIKYLGGAAITIPIFSIILFIFSLCNIALPLTPNFVGEFICLCSIFAHNGWALCFALLGVILSAAYTIWAYARVVHGIPKKTAFIAITDLNRRETFSLLPLLVLALWWGLKPGHTLDQITGGLWFWQIVSFGNEAPAIWALLI
jgi:proton-translocating NADH-quinone oxidoreductase chain M